MFRLPHLAFTPFKRLVALGLAITLGFSAVGWKALDDMNDRDVELARANAANLVAAIGSEIVRNFEIYGLSLQNVVEGLRQPDIAMLPAYVRQMVLFDRAASAQGLGAILVLDENGVVRMDSRTETPRRDNYAMQDFFREHRSRSVDGSYISRPWITEDGEHVIAISRRLEKDDGSFAGVVFGTMKLSYFYDLLRKPQRNNIGDAISLARDDGTLMMRLPFDVSFIGRNVADSETFQNIGTEEFGSFEANAAIDGKRRMYVYQRLRPLPFMLFYGISTNQLYGEWYRQASYIAIVLLVLCLTNFGLIVVLVRSLQERDVAKAALQEMVVTDKLTGLRNRRGLDQVFDTEWRRAQRSKKPLSLLMIDADHFKQYNDTYGHQAGDVALALLAGCIARSARRAGDCAARYGGEEFALLLPETKIDDAYAVAERVRHGVEEIRAGQKRNGAVVLPTVSIGIAEMIPQADQRPTALLESADTALYQAKESGRNRIVAAGLRAVKKQELVA